MDVDPSHLVGDTGLIYSDVDRDEQMDRAVEVNKEGDPGADIDEIDLG